MGRIAYGLEIFQNISRGITERETRNAKDCKEVFFLDGTHYKNIPFKEILTQNKPPHQSADGVGNKLCKVLYESEFIKLYLFDNKETVLLKKDSKTGQSTLSKNYVFNFKKEISKIAEGANPVQKKYRQIHIKILPKALSLFVKM